MDKDVLGAIVLIVLLIFQQFMSRRKGNENYYRVQQENNKLARQTAETVTRCSERTTASINATQQLMESIKKHLEKDDIGRLSSRVDEAVQMLVKMVDHQNVCLRTLDGVASLSRSIADDLQKTDSRLVHEKMQHKLHEVETMVNDIKKELLR